MSANIFLVFWRAARAIFAKNEVSSFCANGQEHCTWSEPCTLCWEAVEHPPFAPAQSPAQDAAPCADSGVTAERPAAPEAGEFVPWHGGAAAPDDWDRGEVLLECGDLYLPTNPNQAFSIPGWIIGYRRSPR